MLKSWVLFFIVCGSLFSSCTGKTDKDVYAAVEQKESVVYITKTGEKYHKEKCRHLAKSSIQVSRKEAIKNGYTACKVCKP